MLYKLQHKVDIVTVKHHIQLNVNIWTNNNNLPHSKKRTRFISTSSINSIYYAWKWVGTWKGGYYMECFINRWINWVFCKGQFPHTHYPPCYLIGSPWPPLETYLNVTWIQVWMGGHLLPRTWTRPLQGGPWP